MIELHLKGHFSARYLFQRAGTVRVGHHNYLAHMMPERVNLSVSSSPSQLRCATPCSCQQ
ncbi:hypothetical protein R5R35_006470 [Gryllus longicercus]|uniref:Uncharacterized protein n=1 Tax=Gryllus longicercus TaxID=2509291 RepID=A0AAN9W5H2_9ORTH